LGTLLAGGLSSAPNTGTITSLIPVQYTLNPSLGTNTAITAAIGLKATAQTGITTGITQPDFPRVLLAKGVGSNLVGSVVLHGLDASGAVISDTIILSGASAVSGALAFMTITSIDLPIRTNGSGDTVSIGTENVVGFPTAILNTAQVSVKNFNGSVDAGTVTAAATVSGSLYSPAGTFDGTKKLSLVFVIAS